MAGQSCTVAFNLPGEQTIYARLHSHSRCRFRHRCLMDDAGVVATLKELIARPLPPTPGQSLACGSSRLRGGTVPTGVI